MKIESKQLVFLMIGVVLCGAVFSYGWIVSTTMKPEYTVEIYEIFEVDHTENKAGQPWTNVYTYGKGQFFFRGDHDINASKSYVFMYTKNGKRWRDLTLISHREIEVKVRVH
jgi:hypothetical protein